ncbi:WASH complex [Aphelenchoides avenae]|nr:WASH complex [Aphelenchus avenae]
MDPKPQDHQRQILEHFILSANCIIAEIHRISANLPSEFIEPSTSHFVKLLVDFSHFENSSALEAFVDTNEGRSLDEEFYERFETYLRSFSRMLESLCSLLFDFVDYTEKAVISHNLMDRRQRELNALKCKALYLVGISLLLLDSKFPEGVRERLFVAYYRARADLKPKYFELLVSLLRNRKEAYESCFQHIQVNTVFVDQGDDVPSDYVSGKQAAMMYTCLFFKPDILHNQFSTMRQIVDKYFLEQWVVPIHVELTVNLIDKWDGYKAANAALMNTIDQSNVTRRTALKADKLRSLTLPAGLLSVESLDEYGRLIGVYNLHLQWLTLHYGDFKSKKLPTLPKIVSATSKMSTTDLFAFHTKIAQFEFKFRQSCGYLVAHKEDECSRLKARICNVTDQIIAFLSTPMLQGNNLNERLSAWFTNIKDSYNQIAPLAESAVLIEHVVAKITEVSEFYEGEFVILKQYFTLIVADLNRLRSLCLIDADFVDRLTEMADSTYLWSFFDIWPSQYENLLKNDALAVKYVFKKLSASIENILRDVVDEEKKAKLAESYHRKLESRLRRIIQASRTYVMCLLTESVQIIPKAIFDELDELQKLFPVTTNVQIEKHNIRQFADLDRRRKLSRKTYDVTRLAMGISNMAIGRLGSVEIRPTELLSDGFREELYGRLRRILDITEVNLLRRLAVQTRQLQAFREAFLFVCGHIGINGAVLWQSQIERLLEAEIQAEKSRLRAKVASASASQQRSTQKMQVIGEVNDALVSLTNPRQAYLWISYSNSASFRTTVHLPMSGEWFSADRRRLEFSTKIFGVVENWLPAVAIPGLHRLISYSIHYHTGSVLRELEKALPFLQRSLVSVNAKSINALGNSTEFGDVHARLLPAITKIGHLKVIERALFAQMEESCTLRMEAIFNATDNLLKYVGV